MKQFSKFNSAAALIAMALVLSACPNKNSDPAPASAPVTNGMPGLGPMVNCSNRPDYIGRNQWSGQLMVNDTNSQDFWQFNNITGMPWGDVYQVTIQTTDDQVPSQRVYYRIVSINGGGISGYGTALPRDGGGGIIIYPTQNNGGMQTNQYPGQQYPVQAGYPYGPNTGGQCQIPDNMNKGFIIRADYRGSNQIHRGLQVSIQINAHEIANGQLLPANLGGNRY